MTYPKIWISDAASGTPTLYVQWSEHGPVAEVMRSGGIGYRMTVPEQAQPVFWSLLDPERTY